MTKPVRKPRFVSAHAIASELNVSPMSVYRWLNEGTLPGYKFGRSWRIEVDDYLAFVDRSLVEPE